LSVQKCKTEHGENEKTTKENVDFTVPRVVRTYHAFCIHRIRSVFPFRKTVFTRQLSRRRIHYLLLCCCAGAGQGKLKETESIVVYNVKCDIYILKYNYEIKTITRSVYDPSVCRARLAPRSQSWGLVQRKRLWNSPTGNNLCRCQTRLSAYKSDRSGARSANKRTTSVKGSTPGFGKKRSETRFASNEYERVRGDHTEEPVTIGPAPPTGLPRKRVPTCCGPRRLSRCRTAQA